MSKFLLFLRHAVALIREDKLFSAIYVAGTAVAIASAMVVVLVLHIRISNIYPEVNRDRTVMVRSLVFRRNQQRCRHRLFTPRHRGGVQPSTVR